TLINDPNNPNAIRAYQESPVNRPYVSRTLPAVNYGYAFSDQDVIIDITDGAFALTGIPILRINNVDQIITTAKTNSLTTVKRTGSLTNLLFSGANYVILIYSYPPAGGNVVSVTNTWAFTVPAYTRPIPAANKVLASQVSGRGFHVRAARE